MALSTKTKLVLKITFASALVALLIVLFLINYAEPVFAISSAIAAGICVLIKEVLTAFARSPELSARAEGMKDYAAVASLYAAIFGVPAVVATVAQIAAT